ncbi:hypothetical protein AKJ55_01465 [candidate division MSBL1 archaeon SCGC-AAA382M17]|uniref:Amidohydrolase-related domain-containing protein n=1 Tax=candidate division MSBL1 archaeon SCGC-AAA382M17 TaxID=1698284 RepID=A0ABR5TJC4_9EURY|nr:hypothetical protein AKJ55_01465 [candidate division MSBL1 archaeon SCGC-AAA382M17]
METELVLKGGKVALPTGITEANISVGDEKILSISKTLSRGVEKEAERVVDCSGKLVLPGGIDFHTHIPDLGYSDREDWKTGTESAAAGGTTFVVELGQTDPPSTNRENFKKIRKTAERKAVVDFGINGNITHENLDSLGKLVEEGVKTFGEIYMAESIPELEMIEDGVLLEAFEKISSLDCLAGVHAEDWQIISHLTENMKREGRNDSLAHLEARPSIAEEEAIARALLFARRTGVRLHVYHLSTEAGLKLIEEAKEKGQDVSTEVTAHHLLFERGDMEEKGPYLKCNPPIRGKSDQKALWNGLKSGTIDMVTTDHYSLPRSMKKVGWENIWEAGAGMAGVETRIPLLLTHGVKNNRISIRTFLKVVSENPARRLGLWPRKGVISVGSDADLTVVDMDEEKEIRAEETFTKCEHTPYEGEKVVGMPVLTLVRGKVVMEDGEIVAEPGHGNFF